MKQTRKKIIGILGLVFVIAMTILAYSLPEPDQPFKIASDIAKIEK